MTTDVKDDVEKLSSLLCRQAKIDYDRCLVHVRKMITEAYQDNPIAVGVLRDSNLRAVLEEHNDGRRDISEILDAMDKLS